MTDKDVLEDYHRKRDFARTKEPAGGRKPPGKQPVFVIQKHDATNLHYDFRLEVDGVLKSWAVPKGPSTDPRVRRLAIPTEDHPLEYADFESVIPEGEYGGGVVLVWDTGTYRNLRQNQADSPADMATSIRQGGVEVWLEGKKLRGGYTLVRTGKSQDANWLLIKQKDECADARRNPTSTQPESVLTGRTLEEIAAEESQERQS
jgi:DNA ligase D-like protein (predicted 3'-phosphoesterase)